jgi:hypothetical protein
MIAQKNIKKSFNGAATAKDFPISEIAAKAIKEYLVERGSYNQHEPLFHSRKASSLIRYYVFICNTD